MKSYVVGGAVRDRLLGLAVVDRDHVVVGATVDEMLAAGFRPVGKDFPVFLHPETHEEYALARTERKVAPGYTGFVFHADPHVTLEDDLARRDLTINAMAEDDAGGRLVDPFGGAADLAAKRLRHIGPAFVEDPVRILRVARFAARFADFTVADETIALMRTMVASGEVDALVPERVWQELSRGLMEAAPSRMLAVLATSGAWARVLPGLGDGATPSTGTALDAAAARGAPLPVRYALLVMDAPDADALSGRLRVPSAVRDVAALFARERASLADDDASTDARVKVMERCDAFRRRERFAQVLVAHALATGTDALRWSSDVAAATAIDAGAVAKASGYDPSAVARDLHRARVAAVAANEKGASRRPSGSDRDGQ